MSEHHGQTRGIDRDDPTTAHLAAPNHGGARELLTEAEHTAMALTATLFNSVAAIIENGGARLGDRTEMAGHIHAVQNMILAQAAARAYPDRYRLLGGEVVRA